MDRRKKLSGRGFTLIEVTLAIVIGVIMIAGATLLYNQSKISSGNSRAQAKVLALQQLIEEFAANNAGTYPDVAAVRSLFKRKRPDDYLKSPWGGMVGVTLQDSSDTGTRGIKDNSTNTTDAKTPWAGDTTNSLTGTASVVTAGVNAAPAGDKPLTDQALSGGLSFSLNDKSSGTEGQNNTETRPVWDAVTNVTKIVRGYAIWIYDQQGQYPNFVTGGKPQ